MTIPFFSHIDYIGHCLCIDILDTNQYVVVFPFNNKQYKWICKLKNINMPSIHSQNLYEKKYAMTIFEIIKNKLYNKNFNIRCHDFHLYSKSSTLILNIDIYIDNESFNDWVIDNNYGVTFDISWSNYVLSKDIYSIFL